MEIKFKKVHTAKDLTLSSILSAAGIGLYFINAGLGTVTAVCGLLMLLFWKNGYKTEGKDLLLQHKAVDLSKSCRASVLDFLSGKDIIPEFRAGNEGGSIRLEVWYNETEKTAFACLYDFENYIYEAATDIVELHDARADRLIARL